ncbi:VPS10 domain-containing receptor, partial [Takifugu flavidus]
MERGIQFSPKWQSLLLALLLVALWFSRSSKSEITCRSCQPGNKRRPQELLLKFDAGIKGEVFGAVKGATSAESQRRRCAEGSTECVQQRAVSVMERNTRHLLPSGDPGESFRSKTKVSPVSGQQEVTEASVSDTELRKRLRRNADTKSEGRLSARTQTLSASAAPRRVTRWSGEERKAAAARQDEPKLNSSTFALTGDSSHNQAMVLWSGQNSSIWYWLNEHMTFFIFTFSLLVLRVTLEQVEVIVLGTGGGDLLVLLKVLESTNTSAFVTAGEETPRTEARVDRDRQ